MIINSRHSLGRLILKDGESDLNSIVLVVLLTLVSTLVFVVVAFVVGFGGGSHLFH